ncbi:MAG: ABC transporter ATP-binding protein [Myxococcales bacterium]|nr:ABC transporter ATP-binding protein [Myxococcales bacterium]
MISIEGLEVSYGSVRAVAGLSLDVPKGSLFGLLGPNGAGKTTTILCIAGLRAPTAGKVRVGGRDPVRDAAVVRRMLGLVPQNLALYQDLSVRDNLRFFGGLFGVEGAKLTSRVAWGLDLAELGSRAAATVSTLSGGMKRRLNLACGLLHEPELLVCDEPTTGVDPQSRNHLFETIRRLNAEGRTVVYTTHYMEEVEALCSRVAILDHGRLVACDELATLLAAGASERHFELELTRAATPDAVRRALDAAGLASDKLAAAPRSLEQVFLDLTGHGLRDDD